jgi:hypothetical protein
MRLKKPERWVLGAATRRWNLLARAVNESIA